MTAQEIIEKHGEPYGVSMQSSGTYADCLPKGTIILHNRDDSWDVQTIGPEAKILHRGRGTNLWEALTDYYKDIMHPVTMYPDFPNGWTKTENGEWMP